MRSVQTKVLDSGDGPTTYMIVDSVLPEDIAILLIKANIYRIIRQVEPNISVPREIRAHLVQGA
jgi:hypothetical protein